MQRVALVFVQHGVRLGHRRIFRRVTARLRPFAEMTTK